MDKTGITVVTICALLLGAWFYESSKNEASLARQRALQNANVVATTETPVVSSPVSTLEVPGVALGTNALEQTIVLTNTFLTVGGRTNSVRYTFTSQGGGIKSVGLLDYAETISPRWKKDDGTNAVATLNAGAPMPVMAIVGDPGLIGDGDFSLTRIKDGVEAEKPLPDGLVLTKDFHLSSNYLVNVVVTLKNDSGKPVSLAAQDWIVGTATPMDIDDVSYSTYGGSMWCNGDTFFPCTPAYFNTNTTILGFYPRTPKTEFSAGSGNVLWGAAYNQFFVLMAMPKTNQPAQQMVARPVNLPGTNYRSSVSPVGVQASLVYPAETLVADQVVQRQITLYAGPKEFRTLEEVGEDLQNHADLAMNFGTGFAGFWGIGSFFAKILLSAMNGLHDLLPALSYGWLIVLLTVLLRGIFWPIMATSMRSMKKMQALAPEVKKLKEKYGDDPQKFTQKQMELWRENKVSPMSGCLPMLLQTPVFLGFFTMIRSAIELRGAHFMWIPDLTKPDTIFIIPGLDIPFNLLPLVMVGVMVWQAHLQPVSPGVDPSQQKMMRYMPLIFLVIFYNYSAGMALYLTISTLMGILQTRLIKTSTLTPVVSTEVSVLTPTPKKKK
jgi:YidC/Oxa1 family membrane protein insertase